MRLEAPLLKDARNLAHLARAAAVLARYDALVPQEARARLPRPALIASAALARLAPGPKEPAAARQCQGETGLARHGARLAEALHSLGPSYIKLGQLLATRPDVVGPEIAKGLARLKDDLPPFPVDEARRIVAAELGHPVEELFAIFEPATAAASIAQVHRAFVPGPEGPVPVAVKILRPGIEEAFARDLDAFAFLARALERVIPSVRRLRPCEVVATLNRSVSGEMDLRLEGAAASELAETRARLPDFRVPAVDWTRTSKRVLTMEWIDGIRLSDREALIAAGHDVKRLAKLVIEVFLTHALFRGFFHADMHEGNLFVDTDGRLVAVDFGIMGRLDRATRRYTAEILHGFHRRDYMRIARQHFEAGYVPSHHSVDAFALALRSVGERVWGRPSSEISMARLLAQLFEVTERFDMALQPGLLMLQKTMVVAEGVARTLDPEHNLWESSRGVLEAWMLEETGPEARLKEVADSAATLTRAVQELPTLMRLVENAEAALTGEGVRLHPETARVIGQAEVRSNRPLIWAAWIAAIALALIAIASLW